MTKNAVGIGDLEISLPGGVAGFYALCLFEFSYIPC
jgi:hypothetical protein